VFAEPLWYYVNPFQKVFISKAAWMEYRQNYSRWQLLWEINRADPTNRGKKWYQVPNPEIAGAEGYPPGFLKKKLQAAVIFTNDTTTTDGHYWARSILPPIASIEDLEKGLKTIPDNSLDMLILSGHMPNSPSQHCGVRCKDDNRKFNIDETTLPEATARLIRSKLRSDGILVIAACRAGGNPDSVRAFARKVKRAVAAPKGICAGVKDFTGADIDGTFWWYGGYNSKGYEIQEP
jgi:hypothetical protein